MESKYSLKKRISYISCIPEGSGSPVTRHIPLKVTERSLEQLFSSIDDHLGTHYRSGGTTPDGFDCSGFVQYLYKQNFRMLLPRTSGELALLGSMVPKKQLHPGDLVFFSSDGSRVDHVGIFIGDNRFAHASTGGVRINKLLDQYYNLHYACASHLITTE
jgi:cell wall-associated NlpC family hydrolase